MRGPPLLVLTALALACNPASSSPENSTSTETTASETADAAATGMPTTTGTATDGGTLPDTDGATNTATESPPVVECPVAFTNTVSDLDGDGHNDAYISNQDQLAELAGCTDMSGSLYLNSGVTDLTPLVSLRHIAGKLDIGGSSYTTEPKGLLSLAGLEALESVGGLVIKNVSMTDLEPLAGLTSIPGDVQITGLLRLESLEGLHNLEHIGGELNIGDGKQLLDLNGLRNLQQVGTHIFISQLEITSLHGLEALTEVGVPGGEPSTIRLYGLHQLTSLDALAIDWHDAHALWIYQSAISDLGILAGVDELNSLELLDNKMLMDLAGLESLVVVHDVLALDGNDNLIDIDALASLQSVGALTLNDSPLTDLGPLPALQQVGDVRVAQNEQLIALSALAGFTSVGSLVLEDNPALAVVPDLAALTQLDGNLEIRRNDALISITDLSAVTKVGGRLVVVVNPELPEADAETWAAPINVGGDRKIAGNKQDPAPPASPCPWVEDGECDEDANGLGICAPNTDEQDCIFG